MAGVWPNSRRRPPTDSRDPEQVRHRERPGEDAAECSARREKAKPATTTGPSKYTQKFLSAAGTGSLELARGSDHLTANGVVLTGEKDIVGKAFNSTTMATLEAAGSS